MNDDAREDASIRVLEVDDDDLFRTGLASLLGSQTVIDVIAQASGARGRAARGRASALRGSDATLGCPISEVTRQRARSSSTTSPTRVVALTAASEDVDVAAVVSAGACGFLAKERRSKVMRSRSVRPGQSWAWRSPRAAEVVLGRVLGTSQSEAPRTTPLRDLLSSPELDVCVALPAARRTPRSRKS